MMEEVELFGRRFRLAIAGPDADRRFSATIEDLATGRVLTRNPVRGRSADDVRDRALEVVHNLVSIERLHEVVLAAAREMAPGAMVELTEDARAVRADLGGAWSLAVPFSVERDEVYDPDFDPELLADRVRDHFAAHLRRSNA